MFGYKSPIETQEPYLGLIIAEAIAEGWGIMARALRRQKQLRKEYTGLNSVTVT
jgi:hypothetical protein